MIVLDTDTLTLLLMDHAKVVARYKSAQEKVVISIITRIEVLQGRFESLMKALDAKELLIAHR
ncbi:MAG: hypothetical protein EXS16_03050 [Gemmataceae bacterium]|nr:hypothetical protein [Gemmataceae bacterium]